MSETSPSITELNKSEIIRFIDQSITDIENSGYEDDIEISTIKTSLQNLKQKVQSGRMTFGEARMHAQELEDQAKSAITSREWRKKKEGQQGLIKRILNSFKGGN